MPGVPGVLAPSPGLSRDSHAQAGCLLSSALPHPRPPATREVPEPRLPPGPPLPPGGSARQDSPLVTPHWAPPLVPPTTPSRASGLAALTSCLPAPLLWPRACLPLKSPVTAREGRAAWPPCRPRSSPSGHRGQGRETRWKAGGSRRGLRVPVSKRAVDPTPGVRPAPTTAEQRPPAPFWRRHLVAFP